MATNPLREVFHVSDEGSQEFEFLLDLLPDLLDIKSSPVDQASVSIDGEPIGQTPMSGIELQAGEHSVELTAPRYQAYSEVLSVAGGGHSIELVTVLIPAWSDVAIDSIPGGAVISVDGEEAGQTPATLEIMQGRREIRLTLPGYKAWQSRLEVPANDALTVPPVELQVADGRLVINTRPGNANILIDGQFAGQSRLEINLEPGKSYRIEAHKTGYRDAGKTVTITSGQEQAITLNLQADLGEVAIQMQPEDATISINGRETELVNGKIQLPAVPQQITISKPGYVSWQTTVTPKPGFTQQIDARLKTEEQAKWEAVKPQLVTSAGQTLKLIRPGRFTMGASRREAGRRANEGLREVELTHPYYLATREVTNAQYRLFKADHSSGRADRHSLNGDDQPVVNITWEDAARYCNWLSERDGLNPSYRFSGDELQEFDAQANGYRLPTEAEWAWAARVTLEGLLKFPLGRSVAA